jgi:hypothetical protein
MAKTCADILTKILAALRSIPEVIMNTDKLSRLVLPTRS